MTSPAGPPSTEELRRALISAVQAWTFRTDEPISAVICIRGHDRAKHSYINAQGNQTCRECNRLSMRRLRAGGK
jgi:hypothetical protein